LRIHGSTPATLIQHILISLIVADGHCACALQKEIADGQFSEWQCRFHVIVSGKGTGARLAMIDDRRSRQKMDHILAADRLIQLPNNKSKMVLGL
jgi:hypothetical protein